MQELGDVAANIQAVGSSIFGSEPDFSDTFLTDKFQHLSPQRMGDWSWLVNVSFKHQLMKESLVNVLITRLVEGKIYRKPLFLPSNKRVSCKFSHHPIL